MPRAGTENRRPAAKLVKRRERRGRRNGDEATASGAVPGGSGPAGGSGGTGHAGAAAQSGAEASRTAARSGAAKAGNAAAKPRVRHGPKPAAALSRPDFPYTMKLPDGRIVALELPGRWVERDRDGSPAFLPEAVELLDRVRALFLSALGRPPSPGYLVRLREGLGLTQVEFGRRCGVHALTVSRWERGEVRPAEDAMRKIEALRRDALRRGVAVGV